MSKIDLTIHQEGLRHNIEKARENRVVIPTFAQMEHPETIPEKIQARLKHVGLWDVDPLNLFRITWKNEARESGGLFQAVPNFVEIPSALSGVPCRILAMAGKPVALMNKDDRMRAVRFLNEHGAFLITKSSDKVAKFFGISKYTLYSYIDSKQEDSRHEQD